MEAGILGYAPAPGKVGGDRASGQPKPPAGRRFRAGRWLDFERRLPRAQPDRMTQPPQPELPALQADRADERRIAWGLPFPRWEGVRGELAILALFVLATVVLTWPVAITMDRATGLRGDYFNNIWNAWWLRKSLLEGASPFWTDYLYYPEGISLKRHTLSLYNAGLGAFFGSFLSPHAAFNAVMLWHLVWSGWTFSLLARYATGSTLGAVLGGLCYSFAPFHLYYLCQVNVFTWEIVPLALLFFLRYYSHGRKTDLAGVGVAMLAVAASTSYFVMYTLLVAGLLFVFGPSWDRAVPRRTGCLRTAVAGLVGGVGVAVGAFPLLWAMVGPESALEAAISVSDQAQGRRENDLLGYFWLGGPEQTVVSWPTMLGYGTLLLWVLGRKGLRSQPFWLWTGGIFCVLSLGADLDVGRAETGVPLPFAAFKHLPVLSMLRKADRFFFLIQLAAGILTAAAFAGFARRFGHEAKRLWAFLVVALVLLFETNAVPFARYDYEAPAWFDELAAEEDIEAVLEVPPGEIDVVNARMLLGQVKHGKRIPLGYTTSMAVSTVQEKRHLEVINKFYHFLQPLIRGQSISGDRHMPFPRMVREIGVDRVIYRKSIPRSREPDPAIHERVLWAPFFLVRRSLMDVRQSGRYVDQRIDDARMSGFRAYFAGAFGLPLHEDEDVIVFEVK